MKPETRLSRLFEGGSLKIKVIRGTPKHDGQSLCITCSNSVVIEGFRENDCRINCQKLYDSKHATIEFPVARCSGYEDKRLASKYEMEQIAWVLVTKGAGREVGFVKMSEMKKDE